MYVYVCVYVYVLYRIYITIILITTIIIITTTITTTPSSFICSAICQEAGMQAVRKNRLVCVCIHVCVCVCIVILIIITITTTTTTRYVILPKDFDEAYKKLVKKTEKEFNFYSS